MTTNHNQNDNEETKNFTPLIWAVPNQFTCMSVRLHTAHKYLLCVGIDLVSFLVFFEFVCVYECIIINKMRIWDSAHFIQEMLHQ